MEIIQFCLPSMMNVFSLLFLVFFIYSVLGCYLFAGFPKGLYVSDWFNFDNFGFAMMFLFKLSTGEDWNFFMMEYAHTQTIVQQELAVGIYVAFAYFITFKFVVTFVMINLFVLVVLSFLKNTLLKQTILSANSRKILKNSNRTGFLLAQLIQDTCSSRLNC